MYKLDSIMLNVINEIDNALRGLCKFQVNNTNIFITIMDYDNAHDCWNEAFDEEKVVSFLSQLSNRCEYREMGASDMFFIFNEYKLCFDFTSEH